MTVTPGSPWAASCTDESEPTGHQGGKRQSKETKCGAMGDEESEHLMVPVKQGNSLQETLWRDGDASI